MRTDQEIRDEVAGQTIPTQFALTVAAQGDHVALRSKRGDGTWEEQTFSELADKAGRIAAGLASKGIGRGDRVVLMMRNIPEFHAADVGALLCGATPVSIYNSSSADQVRYLVGHCEAKAAILEDATFLDRFLKVRDAIPSLEHIYVIRPDGDLPAGVEPFDLLLDHDPAPLAESSLVAQPEDLATIIYTSGTTGDPKGVMLSHFNICWTAESVRGALDFDETVGKRLISYLPMAHVAERVVSHYSALFYAFEVTTCPETSMLAAYLGEVRPNVLFGVPRVWEKLHGGIIAALATDPEKHEKVNEAVAAALPIEEAKRDGTVTQEQLETWDFLDQVAFSTIRQLVGLDELVIAVSAAAPIAADLIRWFRAIGVPLTEVYGMSENCGPMTASIYAPKPGTVGPPFPGVEVKVAEDGEVCCRGGLVFQGYLKDPVRTAETIDEDGWLHSGDVGEFDEDGYLRIIDRKKELIITAGGKNISPANLEAALKLIPIVGQAAAVGDNRPFIAAIVALDPDVAPVWAAENGIEAKSLAELAEDPRVIAEVERGVAEVMSVFNNAERVKKVKVVGEEWVADSDVLTPTSKLKRRGIQTRYADVIEAFYN